MNDGGITETWNVFVWLVTPEPLPVAVTVTLLAAALPAAATRLITALVDPAAIVALFGVTPAVTGRETFAGSRVARVPALCSAEVRRVGNLLI